MNVAAWTWANRPAEPSQAFNGQISGLSFSPYQRGQDANEGRHPSSADIDRDLRLLAANNVGSVRTYTSLDGIEETARLARDYGLKVTAGAWLGSKPEINEAEVASLINVAKANRNVDKLIVGNESILRGEQTVPQVIDEIHKVRKAVRRPISTAEPWHVWQAHPELVKEVDFLAVQLLPYWEGIPVDQAVRYVLKRYYDLKIAYPGKKIVISEVGWPSEGKARQGAEASIVNQARFTREFLAAAKEHGIEYFVMEAFDQPWKMSFEGTAGGYWGIFDVDRNPKFSLTGPVEEQPFWPLLAGISSVLGLIAMFAFLPRYNHVGLTGRALFSAVLQVVASGSVWMAVSIFYQYLTPLQATVLGILTACQVILGITIISETFQFIELLWARLRRKIAPAAEAAALPASTRLPKVSLHLPIHNEPAQMVMRTLDSLAKLDYPDFEVIVIDNNTKNPDVWKPVEAYCANLGANFRFFHLDPWPGFKAGALNFALSQTSKDAEVIGVIDSDYIVRTDWLKSLVPYFADPKVGWVQAPQDHREWQDHPFKTMINWEYAGFFHIGMVHRNERNAIIQHGTMTLIRKQAMESVGNWGEWSICEDAELGLRMLEQGYEALYTTETFGQGLTPDDFAGYKKQRFRWVFGAVQIIRHHARQLFLPNFMQKDGSRLTFAQRYHFIAGWLPWFADLMHLGFTVGALFWTIGVIAFPKYVEFPLAIFMVPALSVMGMKFLSSLWLYQIKVPCTVGQRLGAALAAMSLGYTVARGILSGLFFTSTPFMRTPKCEDRPALIGGLMMAWQEGLLFLGAIVAASATAIAYGRWNTEANLWIFMLLIQTIPYASAVAISIVAALPGYRRSKAVEASVAPAAGVAHTENVSV
ncbi:MAG TPA: glycosyltransferase [Alphaproteobacteria bacterium]